MVAYDLINITATQVDNVNAGSTDVLPMALNASVTLDATELATACANASLVVMKAAGTAAMRASLASVVMPSATPAEGRAIIMTALDRVDMVTVRKGWKRI